MVKDDPAELAFSDYWNRRYVKQEGKENTYDWFRDWGHLEVWFKGHLTQRHAKILHLGCGNSTLTADLHTLGFTNQINIDFSDVVIRAMEAKYKGLDTVWKVMDVRQMTGFLDNSFDVAIDKATMDSMIHGSMWDPAADVRENIARYLGEVSRVLVPGGLFLYITYRQRHFMQPLLAREDWAPSVETLNDQEGGVFQYFAYIMKKVDEEGKAHQTRRRNRDQIPETRDFMQNDVKTGIASLAFWSCNVVLQNPDQTPHEVIWDERTSLAFSPRNN